MAAGGKRSGFAAPQRSPEELAQALAALAAGTDEPGARVRSRAAAPPPTRGDRMSALEARVLAAGPPAVELEAVASEPIAVESEPGEVVTEPVAVESEPGEVVTEPVAVESEPGEVVTEPSAHEPELDPGEAWDAPTTSNLVAGTLLGTAAGASSARPAAIAPGAPEVSLMRPAALSGARVRSRAAGRVGRGGGWSAPGTAIGGRGSRRSIVLAVAAVAVVLLAVLQLTSGGSSQPRARAPVIPANGLQTIPAPAPAATIPPPATSTPATSTRASSTPKATGAAKHPHGANATSHKRRHRHRPAKRTKP